MTRVTNQAIKQVLENFPFRAPTAKVKNKLHQMALHSAAPDESAKRMCQSANRFSSTSLMYPWVWPGGLCCVKNLPRCFECSKIRKQRLPRQHQGLILTWQTSGEGVLITKICIPVICTKPCPDIRARCQDVIKCWAEWLGSSAENRDLWFLECLKHYPATLARAGAQSDTAW